MAPILAPRECVEITKPAFGIFFGGSLVPKNLAGRSSAFQYFAWDHSAVNSMVSICVWNEFQIEELNNARNTVSKLPGSTDVLLSCFWKANFKFGLLQID